MQMFQGAKVRNIESGLRGVIQKIESSLVTFAWTRPEDPYMKQEEQLQSSDARMAMIEVFSNVGGWQPLQDILDPKSYTKHTEEREAYWSDMEERERLHLAPLGFYLDEAGKSHNPFWMMYQPGRMRKSIGPAIRGKRRGRTDNERCVKKGSVQVCTHQKDKYVRGPKKGKPKTRIIVPWKGKDAYNAKYRPYHKDMRGWWRAEAGVGRKPAKKKKLKPKRKRE